MESVKHYSQTDSCTLTIVILEWLSSVCGIIAFLFTMYSEADIALVLLPFGYTVFLLFVGKDNIIRWSPGIVVLNVILFLRYVLMPLAMCFTGETSVYILNENNRPFGVPLMLYELLGVAFVLKVTAKRQRTIALTNTPYIESNLRYGSLVAVVLLAILVIIASQNRYLISGFSLIYEGVVEGYTSDDLASGFVTALWDSFLAWIYVWLILIIKKHVKNNLPAILLSILTTYVFLIIIYVGQITVSRWHIVIAFAAALFCLLYLYPKHRIRILLGLTLPVFILVFTASAFKNTGYSWQNITYNQAIGQLFNVSIFDIYLAGPSTVSDSATMYQAIGPFHIFTLFIDTVQNLPFINHWVDKSISTVYIYHQFWHRGDLIMPLIGQSMVYFGWPFAPVMSMLSVYLVRLFDRLFYRAPSLPHVFIAGFAGAWLGVATVLNVTITMSWIGLRIIPFYILILLTELLGEHGKRRIAENDTGSNVIVKPLRITNNRIYEPIIRPCKGGDTS